ncbi:MAG: hypothetical protein JRG96_15965 [Deltaproteobacteria bacterium]|nr:hypothetical protein [Deltaproteobacteria bacterium]MBW2417912.1 hypothetical protein [Deltaproteobacteria bacterium]
MLKILGALAAIWLLVLAGGVVYYQNCESCQAYVSEMGSTLVAIAESANSPAALEVKALGCDEAMVLPVEKIMGLLEPMLDEAESREMTSSEFSEITMVMCKQQSLTVPSGPDCSEVAMAYGRGAGDAVEPRILVTVQGSASRIRRCAGVYAPDGTRLGDMDF